MAKKKIEEPKVYCRDCALSTNWCNQSVVDGHFIICDCPHHDHALLLNDGRVCNHFKRKLNYI